MKRGQQIKQAVADQRGIHIVLMDSHVRRRDVVQARHEAMALVRKKTGYSLPKIGLLFNRHHSSVLYGIRKDRERTQGETA